MEKISPETNQDIQDANSFDSLQQLQEIMQQTHEIIDNNVEARELSETQENLESYGIIPEVSDRLPQEAVERIETQLMQIEDLTENQTIEGIISNGGEISNVTKLDIRNLQELGIRSENLTPEETREIAAFMNEENDEAIAKKVEYFIDMLTKSINGVRNRRDYTTINYETADKLDRLRIKGSRWLRDGKKSLPEDNIDRDMLRERYGNMEIFDYADRDELIDLGYIDEEEDQYYLGPYTKEEVIFAESFIVKPSWSYREGHKRAGITDERVARTGYMMRSPRISAPSLETVEESMVSTYIGENFESKRRLGMRDLILLFSATSQEVIESGILDKKDDANEEYRDAQTRLRRSLSEGGRYCYMSCQYNGSEVKERFGSGRPVDAGFSREIQQQVEAWTDAHAESVNNNDNGLGMAITEHLLNVQDIYEGLRAMKHEAARQKTEESNQRLAIGTTKIASLLGDTNGEF